MKKVTVFTTAFICSVVLSACGGSGSDVASVPPTNPSSDAKLVIDNGRGTTNNQHAEKGK